MLDLSTLHEIPLFEGLTEKQLRKIQKVLRVQTVDQDGLIIRDGDKGHELFILLDGEVQISKALVPARRKPGGDLRDKSIIRFSARDHAFFGEMALLDKDCKRMANVTATQKSKVAVLRREDFDALINSDLQLGLTLMNNIAKILSSRLGKANQDLIKLTTAFSLALEA